tara:strand:+ start:677 stop:1240 length:564 start_codon:yes stop_codon:yes gene_type:complete
MDNSIICKVCNKRYDITTNSQKLECCDKCYRKQYRLDNIDKFKEKERKSRVKRKKQRTIDNWKMRGVISDDYDKLYDKYINTLNCELCNVELTSGSKGGTRRCLDHCHITHLFRNVVCHICNHRKDKLNQKYDQPYDKGFRMEGSNWRLRKEYNGHKITKNMKNKIHLLCFKYIIQLRILAGHFPRV